MGNWFAKKPSNEVETEEANRPGGIEYEDAAAHVTAQDPLPGSDEEVTANMEDMAAAMMEGETLEIRPEWAAGIARSPFSLVSKFYHPAFALSDAQAQKLGPKIVPLIKKLTDVWIPSWLAGASNRNPEIVDALGAFLIVAWVQYQNVERIRAEEAKARRDAGEHAKNVTPIRTPATVSDDPIETAANAF